MQDRSDCMQTVDVFLFAGQSNMAGRGIVCPRFPETAPALLPGSGWEYRAVTAPCQLCPLEEPFGKNENRPEGISEQLKTGSMVSSFVRAYFALTNTPVVGVSASKGGSIMQEWQPEGAYLTDALGRLTAARQYLTSSGYEIRHTYVLWCQGESDADAGTSKQAYLKGFDAMLNTMLQSGIEKMFLVRIGQCNLPGSYDRYDAMRQWQEEIAASHKHVELVSRCFSSMRERGLMKDAFHYYQAGYNEAGQEAGENTARWVLENS